MKRYFIIDGIKFESERDAAQYICDNQDYDGYAEMLRDCYGDRDGCIDICGMSVDAAIALERVDPIAYRCGFCDYTDSIYSDAKYDLERMDDEDDDDIFGFTVECHEEYDEDEESAA